MESAWLHKSNREKQQRSRGAMNLNDLLFLDVEHWKVIVLCRLTPVRLGKCDPNLPPNILVPMP